MDCLVCGNTIGILRKLSDPQFCSAEHRTQYQAEQQQALIERLRRAGDRVERARTSLLAKRSAAAPPPEPSVASFVPSAPEPSPGERHCFTFGPMCPPGGPARKPVVPVVLPSGPRLAGFALDLPWPCQDLRLKTCPPIAITGQGRQYVAATARVLGAWKPRLMDSAGA